MAVIVHGVELLPTLVMALAVILGSVDARDDRRPD